MKPLLEDLARLRAALAVRRAASVLLGAAAATLALVALAAVAARAGAFRWVGWGPLAVWIAGAATLGAAARRAWRAMRPGAGALRETAALVERERALRRGALVGVVDAARAEPAGTSAALVERAAARLAAALPPGGPAWAPDASRALARRVRGRAAALLAAGGGAAGALWLAGGAAAPLASPFAALRASRAARVVLTVTPSRVPAGGAVEVRVHTTSPWHIVLHRRETGETWRDVPVRAAGEGAARARLTGLTATTFVFATAGRASSDTVRVEVVEPAFVTDLTITAHYPPYLERDDEVLPPDSGTVALPAGTVLDLRGATSLPLRAAALTAGDARVPLAAHGRAFHGALPVWRSAAWTLALTDSGGAPFPPPLPALHVVAVPDSAPTVTLPVPGADTTAPLDLHLPLVVDARDDHALGTVEIVSWRVSRLGVVGPRVVDTVPGMAGADHAVESLVLDMNGRGLLPGDTLRLFARAADRAPRPHVATSRAYAIRLRTMSELRDAVREGVDSLAEASAGLAGDQADLGRRTSDLAAERLQGGDASGETAAEQPAATAPSAGAGALPFHQAQEAGRVRDEQQALLARADSLGQALQQVAQAAAEAGLNDPRWQQQLRQLDSLLKAAITPDMEARLEELRQALERLDPQAVQQALQRLAESQRALRTQLQRSAELFERAALEGSLETYAQNAEALQRAEQQWAGRAPSRQGNDTAAAAAEQDALRRAADSLRAGLDALRPTLAERSDSEAAAAVGRSASQVGRASGRMGRAAAAMSAADQADAQQEGEAAARALDSVPRALRVQRERVTSAWRAAVVKTLHDAEAETATLSMTEQGMADGLRRGEGGNDLVGRQSSVEQGVEAIARSLGAAAGQNALVPPRLAAALGQARQQVEQSRRALEGPRADAGQAAANAQGAAQSLAAAAFEIRQAGDAVSASHSGSGLAEALQRLEAMAREEGGINGQLEGMLPMLGQGSVQDALLLQLRALAARQRQLADQLERLGGQGLPGRPEQLAPEARQLADRLAAGQLDAATMARQQQLYRHLLDAGRSLTSDETDDAHRHSETGRQDLMHVPTGVVPRAAALRYPVPGWEQLKTLTPADRTMVLDYFRRINDRDR